MPFPRHFRSLTTQANKANLLTLLHKMNSFLAAAKPPDHNLWHTILESTYADLTDPVQRPSRVVGGHYCKLLFFLLTFII